MQVMPFSVSSAPSKQNRRNLFLRIVDAIGEANRRKAEREIARFLARHGSQFSDSVERSLVKRFLQHWSSPSSFFLKPYWSLAMILLTALRFVRTVWTEARQMQADAMRRNPHLSGWGWQPAHGSCFHRSNLPMLMPFVLTKVQAWFTYRETVRELDYLSDKELSDLGISRSDIKEIVRQAAK
jgi:uncharacterized protein YjiS (DUF1127 family)